MAQCREAQGTANAFEKEVYDFLCSHLSDEYIVLGSLQIGSRQFDVLVIGPNGIFPVEAKAIRGVVHKERINDQLVVVNAKGEVERLQDRYEPPETQAREQATKIMGFLEKDLGFPRGGRPWVKSILVFPVGNEIRVPLKNRDKSNSDLSPLILTLDEVPGYISSYPTIWRLSQDLIEALAEAFLRDGFEELPSKYQETIRRWNGSRETRKRGETGKRVAHSPQHQNDQQQRAETAVLSRFGVVTGLLVMFLLGFGVWAVLGKGLRQRQSLTSTLSPSLPSPAPTHKALPTPSPLPSSSHILLPSPSLSPSPSPVFTPTASLVSPHTTLTPTPVQRDEAGWSSTVSGLTLTVTKIEPLNNGFRVWMKASNKTKDTLTLPLFMNFYVTDDLGNQYQADPFRSSFPHQVVPGATVSGYALMTKPLDARATTLKVLFSVVYGSLDIRSISVEGIPAP